MIPLFFYHQIFHITKGIHLMKKVYKLENLDCAVCAEKMKNAIAKIEGVESADVSFMLQKLTICAPEEKMEEIAQKAAKAIRKVDSDCKILF